MTGLSAPRQHPFCIKSEQSQNVSYGEQSVNEKLAPNPVQPSTEPKLYLSY